MPIIRTLTSNLNGSKLYRVIPLTFKQQIVKEELLSPSSFTIKRSFSKSVTMVSDMGIFIYLPQISLILILNSVAYCNTNKFRRLIKCLSL